MISILNKKIYFLLLTFLLLIAALPVQAKTQNKNLVNIYFFHSEDCSHCHEETKFLNLLEEKYNNINIYRYEIHEKQNNELRINIQKIYNIKSNGVPLTIIGNTPYIGYSEAKSNLIFIKTIEYYSKYGYKDQVGELIKIKTSSTNKIDEQAPTLDEFIKTYGNYKLIGSLYTDDLEPTSNSLILGMLSQFNLLKIISIIIIVILISKIKEIKKELYLLSNYLTISFLQNTTYIISNYTYTILIETIIIILLALNLIKFIKIKEKHYLANSILIIITMISSCLENHLYATYSKIFKEIINLHYLTGINKISYYGNYFFIIIIINILTIMIFYNLRKKHAKK